MARPSLDITRADRVSTLGRITTDIIKRLLVSDYVVADITYPNANVFYELGLRHASRVGTILIRDKSGPPLPFDLTDLRHIVYTCTPRSGFKELGENLKMQLDWIDASGFEPDNHFLEVAKANRYQFPTYHRPLFPIVIEKAILDQLLLHDFHKENVVFKIEVVGKDSESLEIVTAYSYDVVNRTSELKQWEVGYKFKYPETAKVEEIKFNGRSIHGATMIKNAGLDVLVPQPVESGAKASVLVRVRERYRITDSELFTTYVAATNLTLVLKNPFDEILFDFDILYFVNVVPNELGNEVQICFDRGVLPYQGVKLSWREKRK